MQVWKVTLVIFCCHVLTGTASVTTRYLVNNVMGPAELAFLRYLFGALALSPLFFMARHERFDSALLFKIIALGVLFFGLFPFLFSWSFVHTNAARGSLVLATMPIWAILIENARGHKKLNALQILSTALTLAGLGVALYDKLLTGNYQPGHFKGEFIMLGTALTGAIYATYSRSVLERVSASRMTPPAMLSGCLCLFPFAIAGNVGHDLSALSPLQLFLTVYLGVFAGGLAFFLFNWALNKSTAAYTTLFVALNPITAIFLAYLFLGETIKVNFIIGVIIIFIGLGVAVKSQMR